MPTILCEVEPNNKLGSDLKEHQNLHFDHYRKHTFTFFFFKKKCPLMQPHSIWKDIKSKEQLLKMNPMSNA